MRNSRKAVSCLQATGTSSDTISLGQENSSVAISKKLAFRRLRDPNGFIECPLLYQYPRPKTSVFLFPNCTYFYRCFIILPNSHPNPMVYDPMEEK